MAIGQRCVASNGFAPDYARPHSYRAMQNVLQPESGDVLLNSTGTGTIGRSVVFNAPGRFIVDGHVTVLRSYPELADARWLNAILRTPWLQRHLERFCYAGSTNQLELSRTPLRSSRLPTPGISEQREIGRIVDTLDTAIHKTEAIIAKLKAVKQGLLHDLLTRGIDAHGELRPPQSEAPHLYKDSPLGWIPKEWEPHGVLDVAPADRQCILTGPFGAELGQSDFRSEGIAVLRIGNVQAGFIDWNDIQYVTPEKARSLAKYQVREGDLLFARQGATTGRNALADSAAEGVLINYHIIRVAVDHKKCHPEYLYAAFNSSTAKGQVDQAKGRGTREGINSAQIASLTFGLPQPHEQRIAVERMNSINASIVHEANLLQKLHLQKSGLMDDLLTGRVRVTPLLDRVS